MTETTDDIVQIQNPSEFFRNQIGAFEAISPSGLVFRVTCRPGAKMRIRALSETPYTEESQVLWRIRRLSTPQRAQRA